MKPKLKLQSGFTLIEVIIVVLIFIVILIGLLSLFDWHNKVFSLETADIRATSSARTALTNMNDYIAQTTLIQSFRTISGVTYTTDSDTLVIEMPSLGSDGNYIANTYDYVAYYLNNGSLYETTDFATNSVRPKVTNKKIAENVQSFTLTYNNNDPTQATTVGIDIQVQVQVRGSSIVNAHVNNTVLLRNHQAF